VAVAVAKQLCQKFRAAATAAPGDELEVEEDENKGGDEVDEGEQAQVKDAEQKPQLLLLLVI